MFMFCEIKHFWKLFSEIYKYILHCYILSKNIFLILKMSSQSLKCLFQMMLHNAHRDTYKFG